MVLHNGQPMIECILCIITSFNFLHSYVIIQFALAAALFVRRNFKLGQGLTTRLNY